MDEPTLLDTGCSTAILQFPDKSSRVECRSFVKLRAGPHGTPGDWVPRKDAGGNPGHLPGKLPPCQPPYIVGSQCSGSAGAPLTNTYGDSIFA